jgi:hypothetical protein
MNKRMTGERLAEFVAQGHPLNFDDMEYGDLFRDIYELLQGVQAERERVVACEADMALYQEIHELGRLYRLELEAKIDRLQVPAELESFNG